MNTHVLLSVYYRASFTRNKRVLTFGDFDAPQTGSVESVQDVVLYTTCVQSCLHLLTVHEHLLHRCTPERTCFGC
jgi:hypothetical protein